jgi:intron-binding protein aquarius
VAPAKVGDDKPAIVRAEITLDMTRLSENVKREWDSLRPDDVVFLLAVRPVDESRMITNGGDPRSQAEKLGVRCLRTAEIIHIADENGRQMRDVQGEDGPDRSFSSRSRIRRLQIKLDAKSYKEDHDMVLKGKPDVYEGINVVVRRKGRVSTSTR